MIRTQIYLTELEKNELRVLASKSGKKQSELIREALDGFLKKFHADNYQEVCENLAGVWADRPGSFSADTIREGWDRTF